MGIKNLSKLIADNAPGAVRENEMKSYFDRTIAIDASMQLYQFMIAVRQQDGQMLTNDAGEVTSHLQGLFSRTIRMMGNSLKPVYVFDGKPPDMKGSELADRKKKAEENKELLAKAEESGNTEDALKFGKRTVRVSREQNDEAKKLLKLMGVPYIEATSEAEATCAALCKAGKVFATATEDMDALTFGTPILLRHLNTPESRKQPIMEYDYKMVLTDLGLSHDEFVDLCILCGCDYLDRIQGIGPVSAFKLIKKHKTMEAALKSLDPKKNPIPDNFDYVAARRLFHQAEVTDPATVDIKFSAPDEEGLVAFMCGEKGMGHILHVCLPLNVMHAYHGEYTWPYYCPIPVLQRNVGFNEERIRSGVAKLKKSKKASGQKRLENFFTVTTKRKLPPKKDIKKGKGKGKKGKK